MKEKTKRAYENWLRPIFIRASLSQFSPDFVERLVVGYVRFLDVAFKFLTGLSFGFCFLYFFPVYLGLGWDRTIAVLLVVLIFQLRYGKIKVDMED